MLITLRYALLRGGSHFVQFTAASLHFTVFYLALWIIFYTSIGDDGIGIGIIFLFPLATVLFSLGSIYAVWVVMIFLIILTIGFLYEWCNGTWNYGIHGPIMKCKPIR
jgi:NADH:ubiquinone oxidoreductase subunit 3 (subunit A)